MNIPESTILQKHINQVAQDIFRMGALVEKSFRYCHDALFKRQIEIVPTIINQDREIDKYYKQIELDCAKILTLQSPVAQDVRILSGFMQLVRDLERIGDYAKDLGDIATKLIVYPVHPCMKDIASMSGYTQLMLAKSMVALSELDGNAARKIKLLDDVVDDFYQNLYQALACQTNIEGAVEPILLLTLVIRHLERMADHSTNIAQRVAYIVTGFRG